MAPDGDVCVRQVCHCSGKALDGLLCLRAEDDFVGLEEDTIVESDADSLEAVDFEGLNLGIEGC